MVLAAASVATASPAPTPDMDRETVDLLIRGFQVSRMLRLVADLGIADQVPSEGSVAVHDLATSCGVLAKPLRRILRALAAFQIFAIGANDAVAHTPRSRLLRTDTPNSMHHAARFWAGRGSWGAWGMLDVAMTDGVPHEAAWNMGRFEYLRRHADEARIFDTMMANFPDNRHVAIAEGYDFSRAGLIVDIGGGNGATLRQILARFPTPHGLVFDRDDVISAVTAEDLMQGRISVRSGSFFDAVPQDADIYLLVRVLHDWPDEDCVRILRNCRAAMGPHSLLLIGDQILEPNPSHVRSTSYLVDIQMMAMFGRACERTEAEFRQLLEQSGFSLRRVVHIASPTSILEAVPAT
jgi:hypothetical protein